MKIQPVILCGGSGTRLWPKSKKNLPKQFIDFGGWTLLQKTLERIKNPIFEYPIISTNSSYLDLVRRYLKKNKLQFYPDNNEEIIFHVYWYGILSRKQLLCINSYLADLFGFTQKHLWRRERDSNPRYGCPHT